MHQSVQLLVKLALKFKLRDVGAESGVTAQATHPKKKVDLREQIGKVKRADRVKFHRSPSGGSEVILSICTVLISFPGNYYHSHPLSFDPF